MTTLDLIRLIQRYIQLVILIPLLFIIIAIIWSFFVQASYTATASFITSGDLAFAQGLANKEATSYSNTGISIICSSQSATKQVTVTATGPDSVSCINAANSVANNAANEYKSANNSVVVSVTEADYARRNTPSPLKVSGTALILGILTALCVVVLIDIVKAPIKSQEDAENACDLPVLGFANSVEGGDRILANLEFCCGKRPATTAVIPIGDATGAVVVSNELIGALDRSNIRTKLVKGSPHARKFKVSVPDDAAIVVCCPPLSAGAGATYIANNSDATVLCITEWTDSKRQLLSSIRELKLAKANLAGLAYLPEDKASKQALKAARRGNPREK